MNDTPTVTTRKGAGFAISGSSLLAGLVLGGAVTSVYFTGKIKAAENQHRIDANRAIARFLAWQTSDGQDCSLPVHAYRAWFPFSHYLELEDGAKRYHWVNYSAISDRLGERANRVTGIAWMVLNSDETIREVQYASCD